MSVDSVIRLTGREEITTGLTLNSSIEEIVQDLKITLPLHYANATNIKYLVDYWRGDQPILDRVKEVREDIDNKVIINLAQAATRTIVGYTFGKSIEFINKKENDDDEMTILNNCMTVEDKALVDNEVFTDCSTSGIGYKISIPRKGYTKQMYDMSISPFVIQRLDPQTTFSVWSTAVPKEVIYSVMFHNFRTTNESGSIVDMTQFNIYHGKREYVFMLEGISPNYVSMKNQVGDVVHTLLGNPIIEYRNNMNMSGDWEMAININDALNVVASDSVNDVVQFVQSLLVFINAELDPDKVEALMATKMLSLIAPAGVSADVKYIAEQLDGSTVSELRDWLEEDFNTIVGIPDRKTRGGGGGDTGEAVRLRDGWGDLEIVARNKEPYVSKGERQQLMFAIETLKTYNLIKDLKIYDIEIKFTRNKSDNLLSKVQSYVALMGTETITPEDGVVICDFANDAKELTSKGKSYWDEDSKTETPIETIATTPVDDNNLGQ